MNEVMALIERILRMPRTYGFGVQSPTAYSILRYVLNEHGFLKKNFRQSSVQEKYPIYSTKLDRLLFRLRFHYPNLLVVSTSSFKDKKSFNFLFSNITTKSVLMVLGINRDDKSKLVWKSFLADKRCVLTFDLVDCGLIFFNNNTFKQNFKVNY